MAIVLGLLRKKNLFKLSRLALGSANLIFLYIIGEKNEKTFG